MEELGFFDMLEGATDGRSGSWHGMASPKGSHTHAHKYSAGSKSD